MKKLVTYFSASGVTAEKAQALAKIIGADIHEIAPAERYTVEDLNWTNKKSRSSVEMKDAASRPALLEKTTDLAGYDTVYIGFPIWWYTAPHIINSFIESSDLTGKRIVLFATSGGSNIKKAMEDLRQAYPQLNIVGGKMLNGAVSGDIDDGR